jgi:hypothetical protein
VATEEEIRIRLSAFAATVRDRREELSLTAAQLAEDAAIAVWGIEAIERGELAEPPRRGDFHDAWDGLAAALGWEFDRLRITVAERAAAIERGETPGG